MMGWSLQDLSCLDLPLPCQDDNGLRWFFLLGWLEQSPAAAEWDGSRLRVSQALFDMAALADQVDRAFVENGQEEHSQSASLTNTPGRALITLARTCDGIIALETMDRHGRRSW
jgi:hypothetical protein